MDIPVRHLPHDGQECPSYIVPGNLRTGAYSSQFWPGRRGESATVTAALRLTRCHKLEGLVFLNRKRLEPPDWASRKSRDAIIPTQPAFRFPRE